MQSLFKFIKLQPFSSKQHLETMGLLHATMKKILNPTHEIIWLSDESVIRSRNFEKDGIETSLFPAVEEYNAEILLSKNGFRLQSEIGVSWLPNWKVKKISRSEIPFHTNDKF